MRNKAFILLMTLLIFLLFSCNNHCKNKPIIIKNSKHIDHNILEICFTLENRTGKNIYLSPFSFAFDIKKEMSGKISDARYEFYQATPSRSGDDSISIESAFRKPKKDEKIIGLCGEVNGGAFDKSYRYRDSVVRELIRYVNPTFRIFEKNPDNRFFIWGKGDYKSDVDNAIYEYINFNLDCVFIQKDSKIVLNTMKFDLNKIQFNKLYIRYKYPNNTRNEYSLEWFRKGRTDPDYIKEHWDEYLNYKNQIDSCKIDFPKQLFGYAFYSDSIKSDVIEINKSYY
jgi:hypothetical protein